MRRVACRALSVVTLAAALVVFAGAVTASAASPTAVAWWSRLGVAPPTVPQGGLFVGNDPVGPIAVSAVRVEANDQVTLTLRVASGAVPPPAIATIVACPTTSAWQPPQGGHGDVSDAPQYDCARGTKGMVATDNASISWMLPSHDVALVPDPTVPPVPFAVAFAAPDDRAVLLTTGAPPLPAITPAPTADAPPSTAAPASATTPVTAAPAHVAPVITPSSDATPVPAPVFTAAQPVGFPVPAVDDGFGQRIVAGLALLGLAAGWWFMSNRPQREPRLLVSRP